MLALLEEQGSQVDGAQMHSSLGVQKPPHLGSQDHTPAAQSLIHHRFKVDLGVLAGRRKQPAVEKLRELQGIVTTAVATKMSTTHYTKCRHLGPISLHLIIESFKNY
jgi:hypothetical protein